MQTCPTCGGSGKVVKEKCPKCAGTGYTASKKKIKVTIPAGIDNGQSIRIREKGEPGVNGGPRGDLLVEVNVSRHPVFQRVDMNILSTVSISFAIAALGGEIKIPTVDGDVVCTIKPGTKTVIEKFTGQRRSSGYSSDPDTGSSECRSKRSSQKI